MAILSIIVGVLLIILGISCIGTPLATFATTGILVAILLIVSGVMGLIRAFKGQNTVIGIIMSVLSLFVGGFALFRQGGMLTFDTILVNVLAIYFVAEGILTIILGIQSRKYNSLWGLSLISGVLLILVGIISLTYPLIAAITVGMVIGFFFIVTGVNVIVMGCAFQTVKDNLDDL